MPISSYVWEVRSRAECCRLSPSGFELADLLMWEKNTTVVILMLEVLLITLKAEKHSQYK